MEEEARRTRWKGLKKALFFSSVAMYSSRVTFVSSRCATLAQI
jgi:hypothetical protein